MRKGFFSFFIGILLSFAAHVYAAPIEFGPDGLLMDAKNVDRDFDKRIATLEGNVMIRVGYNQLTCDKAIVYFANNEIVAEGNITLISPDTVIEGAKIRYNYRTSLGTVEDGFVQAGQIVFEGKTVEKTGDATFIARDARFTSCKTCPPAWSFSGSEIKAEVGGYAKIKYPVLRIMNFPIFILPGILIPLKSDRQSGLLVPSLKFSEKGGWAISQSYFWAISRSQDATFTLQNYSNRGLKNHIEYRYVLTENSKGKLQTAFLRDKAFTDDGSDKGNFETINRSFFHYDHYYDLPDRMVHRASINWVTDLRYPRDFAEEMLGHGDPALENSMSLTQNTDTQHRSAEINYYMNLLQEDKLAPNDNAVHRFPEINFSNMEQEVSNSGLFWRFDFNYVNFARRDFSYDDIDGGDWAVPSGEAKEGRVIAAQRDGVFNAEKDLIRTGHRFILEPSLAYPFQIGRYVEVLPSVSYNETQYRFNAGIDPAAASTCPNTTDLTNPLYGRSCDRNAVRRHIQTDLAARTKFSRVFGADDKIANRYKHEIQPELIYSVIPWAERPNHIFFGDFEEQPYSRRDEQVTNSDFFGSSRMQFDYKDRLFNKRLATWVLTNSITRKRYHNDNADYGKLVTFRMAQSYDFYERTRDIPRPWSAINGLLNYRGDQFETATLADYYPYAKVTNWSTRLRYNTLMKNYIELTYLREVFIGTDSKADPSQKNENYGVGLGTKFKFIDLRGLANFSAITQQFDGWEYVALLKPPGECFTIKFGQRQTVGSVVDTEFAFNFEFGD